MFTVEFSGDINDPFWIVEDEGFTYGTYASFQEAQEVCDSLNNI